MLASVSDPTVSFTKRRQVISSTLKELQILPHIALDPTSGLWNTWTKTIPSRPRKKVGIIGAVKVAVVVVVVKMVVFWGIAQQSYIQVSLICFAVVELRDTV